MESDKPKNEDAKLVDNVVPLTRKDLETNRNIVVFEPINYTDVDTIAQKLLEDSAVIIKLGKLDIKSAERMVDFLNGVLFAIHGTIDRLDKNIFICSPKNFKVTK
ncbi:MAG: cell division protein SepF [Lentilactobacillus buchneri]|nr:cell division protein SepF [Lentilactobacillus buchneri]